MAHASPAAQLRSSLDRIASWLEANATPAGASPASAEELSDLAKALRRELPAEVVTLLTFERPLAVFEYARVPPTWWTNQLGYDAVPPEGGGDRSFAAQRWLPFAEDGGGNLWLVDLSLEAPVLRRWERAGREVSQHGCPIPTFFARLALALEAGGLRYEAESGTYDGPFIDLLQAPLITPETVILYRPADLAATSLGLDAAERLPEGAGPYGSLFYVTKQGNTERLFTELPEQEMDHVDEGMRIALDVVELLKHRADFSAFGALASLGFHASPAEAALRWFRAQPELRLVDLATFLLALDADPSTAEVAEVPPAVERDFTIGKQLYDQLVRGDAMIGIVSDLPLHLAQMLGALRRAATAGDARAFAVLGECFFAVLVPMGAFDGVSPEEESDAPLFSDVARTIVDEELPPLTFALRCFYEAAKRGDRAPLDRFAQISTRGPERAQRLALELLADLSLPTAREDFVRGILHAALGEHRESAAAHLAAARRGNADAAFQLSGIFAQGLGVETDPAASHAWLERAADANHRSALHNLAAAYATGTGCENDPAKAAELYESAAMLGHPGSAASLAYMILSGEHDAPEEDACHWLDTADEGGFDTAEMLRSAGLEDPRGESATTPPKSVH